MVRRTMGVILVLIVFMPLSLSAATIGELLQAQINALITQIATLERQLAAAISIKTGTAAVCFNSVRDVRLGMRGEDVVRLQRFLIQTGDYKEEQNGFFRLSTEVAVQKWQTHNGIVSSGTAATTGYGAVGPKTRKAMTCPPGMKESASVQATSTQSARLTKRFCLLGSVAMAHGTSFKFYSTGHVADNAGTSCAASLQTRTCNDGTLGGDAAYTFLTCAEGDPSSCSVGGTKIKNGASATLYASASVPEGESCSNFAQVRTCTNGVLSGGAAFVHGLCVQGQGTGEFTDFFYQTQNYGYGSSTGSGGSSYVPPTNTDSCSYRGESYPWGMRTEGRDANNLCLGPTVSLCIVGTAVLPQFECKNGTWQQVVNSGSYSLPSPTTFLGNCTPDQTGCHFCVSGNYGFWTTAPKCPEDM